jgi:hypothetical protein
LGPTSKGVNGTFCETIKSDESLFYQDEPSLIPGEISSSLIAER